MAYFRHTKLIIKERMGAATHRNAQRPESPAAAAGRGGAAGGGGGAAGATAGGAATAAEEGPVHITGSDKSETGAAAACAEKGLESAAARGNSRDESDGVPLLSGGGGDSVLPGELTQLSPSHRSPPHNTAPPDDSQPAK